MRRFVVNRLILAIWNPTNIREIKYKDNSTLVQATPTTSSIKIENSTDHFTMSCQPTKFNTHTSTKMGITIDNSLNVEPHRVTAHTQHAPPQCVMKDDKKNMLYIPPRIFPPTVEFETQNKYVILELTQQCLTIKRSTQKSNTTRHLYIHLQPPSAEYYIR